MDRVPKVSIGLPVYNGENYLAEAIGSVLRQGFADFELLISDNASTDRTPEIIARFAAQDPRIRWERQDCNRGAAWNYDRTFAMGRAPYFKWLAHDDLIGETFLVEAVALLDAAPEFVGAISRVTTKIDDWGRIREDSIVYDLDPPGLDAAARFRHYLILRHFHCSPFFGLYRRAAMECSDLHGSYEGSDRVFIGEMLLQGRIGHLERARTYYRHHEEQFSRKIYGDPGKVQDWLTPGQRGGRTRTLRLLRGYLAAVGRAVSDRGTKFAAHKAIIRLAWRERRRLGRELFFVMSGFDGDFLKRFWRTWDESVGRTSALFRHEPRQPVERCDHESLQPVLKERTTAEAPERTVQQRPH